MVVPPERIDEVFIEHPEPPPTEKGARGKRVLVTLGLLVLLAVLAALLVWGTAS